MTCAHWRVTSWHKPAFVHKKRDQLAVKRDQLAAKRDQLAVCALFDFN